MERSELGLSGRFEVRCRGRDGKEKWRDSAPNAVTTSMLSVTLGVMFNNSTPSTTWYLGLINNDPSPTLAAADQLNSHSGWEEFTDYVTGTRQEWVEAAASSQSITSSSAAEFVVVWPGGEVYGAFLASASSGSSGWLWATGAFATGVKTVEDGDVIEVTYTVSASAL